MIQVPECGKYGWHIYSMLCLSATGHRIHRILKMPASNPRLTRIKCLFVLPSCTFSTYSPEGAVFQCIIRGGGIGGLTLAVALSRIQPSIDLVNAVEIDIYEASSELTQIGTGITLWPRAWKILVEQLGLGPSLLGHLSGQQVPDDVPRKAAR